MQRLFSGTPWDRPPTCGRCGLLVAQCVCPPEAPETVLVAPETQTAVLKLEKRSKGKFVTVVSNLDPAGNDLPGLATILKSRCASGGTLKEGQIEIQGNRVDAATAALQSLGYKTRRQ